MAKVEYSCWAGEVSNGLTYPECPFIGRWNRKYKDGYCNAPWADDNEYPGFWCGTRQHAAENRCPFDKEEENGSI